MSLVDGFTESSSPSHPTAIPDGFHIGFSLKANSTNHPDLDHPNGSRHSRSTKTNSKFLTTSSLSEGNLVLSSCCMVPLFLLQCVTRTIIGLATTVTSFSAHIHEVFGKSVLHFPLSQPGSIKFPPTINANKLIWAVAAVLGMCLQSSVDAAPVIVDLTDFKSGAGVRFHGAVITGTGYSVSVIGDHNGDGFQDYMFGAFLSDKVVIVMKRDTAYTPMTTESIVSGEFFRVIKGPTGFYTGTVTGGIGDINGDGFDDVIITAPGVAGTSVGYAYVIFGMVGPFTDLTVTATWPASSLGFMILGPNKESYFGAIGRAAYGLGDVNGDGVDDFGLSAYNYYVDDDSGSYGPSIKAAVGTVWVIFGKKTTALWAVDLQFDNVGSSGVYFVGAEANGRVGYSIMPAGDFNGDGVADFLFGAPGIGKAFLIYGSTALASTDLINFATGNMGVCFVDPVGNYFGQYVGGVGDINDDGLDDFAIGGNADDLAKPARYEAGIVYIIYGTKEAFSAQVVVNRNIQFTVGFAILGRSSDYYLSTGAPAGDIDGDGINDFMVSSLSKNGDIDIIYGQKEVRTAHVDLMAADVTTFTYTNGADMGFSIDGGRDLNGDCIPDLLIGGYSASVIPEGGGSLIARAGAVWMIPGPFPDPKKGSAVTPTWPSCKIPSADPSAAPSISPSADPSVVPSVHPTAMDPTMAPSMVPSAVPSVNPSFSPSATPSLDPTAVPSDAPSLVPSANPSVIPSASPSNAPSLVPSVGPTESPSVNPTATPSQVPSVSPSAVPSVGPSENPSASPSVNPSLAPSVVPSVDPSTSPSVRPSAAPSAVPSTNPSAVDPTMAPTMVPSAGPSASPSQDPSIAPSKVPTVTPSVAPSALPSAAPSISPSVGPSVSPTKNPTEQPSLVPTLLPTAAPSTVPTVSLSAVPTTRPTAAAVKDFELSVNVEQDVFFMEKDAYDAQKAAYNLTIQHSVADAISGVTPERITDIVVEEEEEEGRRSSFRTNARSNAAANRPVHLKYKITVRDPVYTVDKLRQQLVQAAQEGRMDINLRFYASQFGATGLSNSSFALPQVTNAAVQRDSSSQLTGVMIALLVIGVIMALWLVVAWFGFGSSLFTPPTSLVPVVKNTPTSSYVNKHN